MRNDTRKQKTKKLTLIVLFTSLLIIALLFTFLYKHKQKTLKDAGEKENVLPVATSKNNQQKPKFVKQMTVQKGISYEDSVAVILEDNNQLHEETDQILAHLNEMFPDTTESNGLKILERETYFLEEQKEEIAKDRLAAIWKYQLLFVETNRLKVDSLLLGSSFENRKDMLVVEFWYSPMNYSGYRYQRGVLTIFGIPKIENTSFIYQHQKLYLVNNSDTIHLIETDDFIPVNYIHK